MHKRNARLQESEFLEKGTGRLCMRQHRKPVENSGTGGKNAEKAKKGESAEILAETPISKGIPGSEKRKENSGGTAKATQTIASKARSVASSIVGKKQRYAVQIIFPHVGSSCRSHQGQVSWRLHHIGT